MAADSDGRMETAPDALDEGGPDVVTTIVTCEGDYYDPEFHDRFKQTLGQLETILCEHEYRQRTTVKNSPCRTGAVDPPPDFYCSEHRLAERDITCRQCMQSRPVGDLLRVAKLEPWNSVRVTLSIPREAAARLRQLASEGSTQLRQLGILSVQVEGDQVISLRLASRFGNEADTQEIVLNTAPASTSTAVADGGGTNTAASSNSIARFLQSTVVAATAAPSATSVPAAPATAPNNCATTSAAVAPQIAEPLPAATSSTRTNEFRSPNVVCPSDTQVPLKAAVVSPSLAATGSTRPHEVLNRPFPFASMQQAAIAIQNRSQQDIHTYTVNNRQVLSNTPSSPAVAPPTPLNGAQPVPFTQPPPPPYPSSTVNKLPANSVQQQQQQQQTAITTGASTASSALVQNIAISSPLLVNLLQNEGVSGPSAPKTDKLNKSKIPTSTVKKEINNSAVVNAGASAFTNIPQCNTKLGDNTRVPPLPQQPHLVGTYGSTQPNVQNLPVVTTSSTVPSHNNKTPLLANQNKLGHPSRLLPPPAASAGPTLAAPATPLVATTPQPPPPPTNHRLQQTQQLRNLQQQLIQQQQTRLLSQPPIQQQQKVAVGANTPIVAGNKTVQAYRTGNFIPNRTVGNVAATVNALGGPVSQQCQPPPYPASRTPQPNRCAITAPNVAVTNPVFQQDFQQRLQQNRVYSTPFPGTAVPDNLLQFGQSMATNLQPIAQPMPHLGLANHLNLDAALSNITPSLTDLSKTDLDSLLPTLADLDSSDLIADIANDIGLGVDEVPTEPPPMEMPEELTSKGKKRLFLINPLSGMLEPMPSESSSSESETEEGEVKKNKKDGVMDVFSELNEHSNSMYSDDDTCSTTLSSTRRGVDVTTDQSDSEATIKSSTSESSSIKSHRTKNNAKSRRESPNLVKIATKTSTKESALPTEKIKLRLKLEKNEPVNPAYKVDVSFINRQEPKRANSGQVTNVLKGPALAFSSSGASITSGTTSSAPTNVEEPRVPPLHISLRGRNSVVISNKSSKKHLLKNLEASDAANFEEKITKKSKIRNKDREGVKSKSRLPHKDMNTNINKLNNSPTGLEDEDKLKNEIKIKSSLMVAKAVSNDIDDVPLTHRREPGDIILPTLKSLDGKKSNKKSFSTKAGEVIHRDQTLLAGSQTISNFDDKLYKKSKFDHISKMTIKSKNDRFKCKEKMLSDLSSDLKKMDDVKLSPLKRPHSSPTINADSIADMGSSINGILHSPESKKRKLSASILETSPTKSPNAPSTTGPACINNIGSTNTGTIPTSTLHRTLTGISSMAGSSNSKLFHTKTPSSLKSRRDKEKLFTDASSYKIKDNGDLLKSSSHRSGASSKSKELNRDKTYSKIIAEKRLNQESMKLAKHISDKSKIGKSEQKIIKTNSLSLPTAGEIDMAAKFKQRLMEDTKPRSFDAEKCKTISKTHSAENSKRMVSKNNMVILNRVGENNILQSRLLLNDLSKEPIETKSDPQHHLQLNTKASQDRLEDNLRQILEQNNDESDIDQRGVDAELLGDINLAQILTDSEADSKQVDKEHDSFKNLDASKLKAACVQVAGTQAQPNRSPPLSNSTGQGEDSGIESMDALSEKSPNNQSSQSPHCHTEIISNLVDTLTGKNSPAPGKFSTNSHDDLEQDIKKDALQQHGKLKKPATDLTELGDIEAELAKMEGYGQNGEVADIILNQLSPSITNDVSSESNLVAQIKSELESSYSMKELEPVTELPSKEDILAHLKGLGEGKIHNVTDFLSKTQLQTDDATNIHLADINILADSPLKDLNENKDSTGTKNTPDDCCTNRIEVDTVPNGVPHEMCLKETPLNELIDTRPEQQPFRDDVQDKILNDHTSESESKDFIEKFTKDDEQSIEISNNADSLVDNDFDPLPMRRTPPLYTYSNPDKQISRNDSVSPIPGLSDIDDGSEYHSDINSEDLIDLLDSEAKSTLTNSSSSKSSIAMRRRKQHSNRNITSSNRMCLEVGESVKEKSLLEQLLIEIPSSEFSEKTSFSSTSHSPAMSEKSLTSTKSSVRTRSSSKLNSPDLTSDAKHNLRTPKHSPSVALKVTDSNSRANSPASLHRASPKINQNLKITKRKRRESESSTQSTQSIEDLSNTTGGTTPATTRNNKKLRKSSENTVELLKVGMGVDMTPIGSDAKPAVGLVVTPAKLNVTSQAAKMPQLGAKNAPRQTKVAVGVATPPIPGRKCATNNEESSDSDEPLIEIAGKVRNNSGSSVVGSLKTVSTRNNKTISTNKVALQTQKAVVDELQKPVVSTRRSVRNNAGVILPPSGLKTRSTKVVAVPPTTAQSSLVGAIIAGDTTVTALDTAQPVVGPNNRRKTRSAVTETLQEKRNRRISKDEDDANFNDSDSDGEYQIEDEADDSDEMYMDAEEEEDEEEDLVSEESGIRRHHHHHSLHHHLEPAAFAFHATRNCENILPISFGVNKFSELGRDADMSSRCAESCD